MIYALEGKGTLSGRRGLRRALQSGRSNVTHNNPSNNQLQFKIKNNNSTNNNPRHTHSTGDKFNKHNKHQHSIRALYQNINGLSATPREHLHI